MFIPHIAYEHSVQYYTSHAPVVYRSLLWHRAQQGKVAELRAELVQPATKKDKNFSGKKIALKKIVANMTMGNDMGPLFTEVVNCVQTASLEVKKMVYLYLVQYARHKPDLANIAVANLILVSSFFLK